jgi:hypothetical protein
MRPLLTLVLLAVLTALAAGDSPLQVELGETTFTVDRPGRTADGRVFYLAGGNSLAVMVYPRSDPTWELIRTPDLALENKPSFTLKPGERMLEQHVLKMQRKDGAWCVKIDYKVAGSSPRDDPKAHTSWHASHYVFLGDKIVIMQGCWFKNGDIDQDYRTFELITESIKTR